MWLREEPSARPVPPGRPPHAVLSSCFSFVAALVPPSHLLFGRLPAARPMSSCRCVVLSPPAAPPAPLASFGMPGFCFWQESAGAVPMVGAGSRQLVGRRSRGLCRMPETGQCGGSAAAGLLGGLRCCRLEARCGRELVGRLGPGQGGERVQPSARCQGVSVDSVSRPTCGLVGACVGTTAWAAD